MKRSIQLILAIVLAIGLVACAGRYSVPNSVLKKAIALSVDRTQQELSQQLRLSAPPKVTIKSVKVNDIDSLKIEDLPSYHVTGSYDFSLKLTKRQTTQPDNSFDLYLQRQAESKTWKLAQQTDEGWIMQKID